MERKDFIRSCGILCITGTAFSVLMQSCGSNYYARFTSESHAITIKKTEFIKNEKNKVEERKYILIRTEELDFPICVYKTGNDYHALFMKCTHKGCELQPSANFLVCPCHGSEFSNKGIVQNPPAEENLRSFIIKTDNENLYIQL